MQYRGGSLCIATHALSSGVTVYENGSRGACMVNRSWLSERWPHAAELKCGVVVVVVVVVGGLLGCDS